ncbi:MAG: DUF2065 domain-containing protein [Burkholderiaceae bacterium]|jgi:uncharacterized protein YjeT (DUF2065 family)|nr:DUF2065 domain-containing protein [Burkholderiaceae bacterium]MEB2319358.1 DUF2065 domain-containing protein [Pseudomonadota bacterium]
MAVGLMLLFEGLLPLLLPQQWREMFLRISRLRDGQIRFFGLIAVLVGGFLLLV